MKLSKKQLEIINCDNSKIVVSASAGSGKTTVLTERVRKLLTDGINPKEIYAITYTNLAAEEMKKRLPITEMFIGTIHSLGNRILEANGVDTTGFRMDEEFDLILEEFKKRENIVFPKVGHLLIDELQDISELEFNFIFNKLQPDNYFCVGDLRQAIYSFRGGNYEIFKKLLTSKRNARFSLEENYRCRKEIINFSENFLTREEKRMENKDICMTNLKGESELVDLPYVLRAIKEDGHYKDWFFLVRTNANLEEIAKRLTGLDIPYISFKKSETNLEQLQSFLQQDVVKLLTVHSAKGLESPKVAVYGCNSMSPEESRVCFVAATRAAEKLLWIPSERTYSRPSPKDTINWDTPAKTTKKYKDNYRTF